MKNYKLLISYLFLALFIAGCGILDKQDQPQYTYPTVKNKPRLLYPMEAQENNYSGDAKVFMHISETGEVASVGILESSGYKILDDAALEYCKNLEFEPAKLDGKPVNARMVQEVKFNFLDNDFTAVSYISQLGRLYSLEKNVTAERKDEIRGQILRKHDKFLKDMGDVLNFNVVLENVLLSEITEEWKDFWNSWPLSFLVYHDFIKRFPDYDNIEKVKKSLQQSLVSDLRYITSTPLRRNESVEDKQGLIAKIKMFVQKHYPDIPLDNLELNARVDI